MCHHCPQPLGLARRDTGLGPSARHTSGRAGGRNLLSPFPSSTPLTLQRFERRRPKQDSTHGAPPCARGAGGRRCQHRMGLKRYKLEPFSFSFNKTQDERGGCKGHLSTEAKLSVLQAARRWSGQTALALLSLGKVPTRPSCGPLPRLPPSNDGYRQDLRAPCRQGSPSCSGTVLCSQG